MRGTALARLVVAGTAVLATAACVAPPLSHPLLLAGSQDATTEIQALLGTPRRSRRTRPGSSQRSPALDEPIPGCELLPAAEVVWRAPASPTTAAIELRTPCDDSVAGTWYELTITGDDQTGFVVALATLLEHLQARRQRHPLGV